MHALAKLATEEGIELQILSGRVRKLEYLLPIGGRYWCVIVFY